VRSAFDAVIAGQSEVSKLIFLVCLLLLALKSSDVYVCRERERAVGGRVANLHLDVLQLY
jgi:hypothetical protein